MFLKDSINRDFTAFKAASLLLPIFSINLLLVLKPKSLLIRTKLATIHCIPLLSQNQRTINLCSFYSSISKQFSVFPFHFLSPKPSKPNSFNHSTLAMFSRPATVFIARFKTHFCLCLTQRHALDKLLFFADVSRELLKYLRCVR